MNELFHIAPSLSPRLKWMQEHQITLIDRGPTFQPGDECELTGKRLYRYQCESPELLIPCLGGDTELRALEMFAAALSLPLWNETNPS